MHDPVNAPAHYTSGAIEVIEIIEAAGLGYHLGNAVKYILRAGKKDPDKEAEDLRKALWYLARVEVRNLTCAPIDAISPVLARAAVAHHVDPDGARGQAAVHLLNGKSRRKVAYYIEQALGELSE